MTTIQTYLAIAGNDANNNDLRTALTTEGFDLHDELRNAASATDPNLGAYLRDKHNVPRGLVNRFITAADDARTAHLQAQAQGVLFLFIFDCICLFFSFSCFFYFFFFFFFFFPCVLSIVQG